MNERPGILLLASNCITIRNEERFRHSYIRNLDRDDGEIIPMRLKDCWLDTARGGYSFCFRRGLLSCFSVMDIPERLHDSMLWKYAIVQDGLFLINRKLVRYRIHGSNASSPFSSVHPNITRRIKSIEYEIDTYQKFIGASEGLHIPTSNQELLRKRIAFMERRRKILGTRNPVSIAIFVMMNLKYYPTLRNALSDIYASIKLRE